MKIQLDGIWHEVLGQGPSPSDLHRMYMGETGYERVWSVQEAYEGEVSSLYRANGFILRHAEIQSPECSTRMHALKIRYQWEDGQNGLIGPGLDDRQQLWIGAIALWVPSYSQKIESRGER